MTQRFDGAITTPDDEIPDHTVVPEPDALIRHRAWSYWKPGTEAETR